MNTNKQKIEKIATTVEDITTNYYGVSLTLTKTAIKQLGL